jgi:hypothetical protein
MRWASRSSRTISEPIQLRWLICSPNGTLRRSVFHFGPFFGFTVGLAALSLRGALSANCYGEPEILPKIVMVRRLRSVADDAGSAPPAGGRLQRVDIGPAGAENAPGTFETGVFVMGNAGNQIEPVLKTFHLGDSFE